MLNYGKGFSAKEDGRKQGQGSSQASYRPSDLAAAIPTINKALKGVVSGVLLGTAVPSQLRKLMYPLVNCLLTVLEAFTSVIRNIKSFNGRYLRDIHIKYEYEKYRLFPF